MKTFKSNKGITLTILIIIIAVIIGTAVTIYFVFIKKDEPKENTTENIVTTQNDTISNSTNDKTENTMPEITTETSKIYNIEGEYFPTIEGANDAPHYKFSNNKVTLEGNYIKTGTYEISAKTIKIHFTKIEGPDEENGKYIDEDEELTVIDENTLEWNGTDGNQVYHTKYVKK